MPDAKPRPVHFLLVEDDPAHAELIRFAFQDNQVANTLDHVDNGTDAMAFLRRETGYENAERPDVILLDLNLPGYSGHEILEMIKSDPQLASIPVVILTTSSNERDRVEAYQHNANSYLNKPVDFGQFQRMMRDLKFYWSIWNQPPIWHQRDNN
jgi:CheY-like chemotaxis protein